jgi:hypothetical protein
VARQFKPWKPYVPPKPPAGSYDPALDAQRAAAQRGLGDLTQDVETAGTRANVDYGRSTELLKQAYGRLGVRQEEQAATSGVIDGGALLQAAAKRAANESTEQTGLDLGYQRGGIDRTTQLTRARRENTAFGLDTDAQIAFQASQAGYVPPGRGEPGGMPQAEHVTPGGRPYRSIVKGGVEYKVGPTGVPFGRRRRVR